MKRLSAQSPTITVNLREVSALILIQFGRVGNEGIATMSDNGVITVACKSKSAKAVADRFAKLAEDAGLLIFTRIDHGANASQVGLELRPTELIIFGHPKGGTPLMQDQQIAGL